METIIYAKALAERRAGAETYSVKTVP